MSGPGVSRRGFLRATAGSVAVVGASNAAAAQDDERPDFGGWLDGVDGGYEDARGQDEVTVEVGAEGNDGAFAFSPAGLWVDPGTTVVWEWTGEGVPHDVAAQEGAEFASELISEAGATFEHVFEESGIVTYQCNPHASMGMKGAVAVGDDVPTGGGSGGGGNDGGGGGLLDVPERETRLPGQFNTIGVAALGAAGMAVAGTLYLTVLGARDDRHAARGVDDAADEE